MKNRFHHRISLSVIVAVLLFSISSVFCYASDIDASADPPAIIPDQIVLSENVYHTTAKLIGFTAQSGKLAVQQLDSEGNSIGINFYPPSTMVEFEFKYSEDLDSAVVTWSKENGDLICDPVTLRFDRIYASDWQALATATHRMDKLFAGKVQVEDDSSEYSSGRLIVKTKKELPDVSDFNVAMIVADDEDHYFLQFETSGEAKECAEYLKQQPGIEYVDIDSVVTVSE